MVPNTSHQPASGCTDNDTSLSFLRAAWPSLPEAVKAGIIAMVRATQGRSSEEASTRRET